MPRPPPTTSQKYLAQAIDAIRRQPRFTTQLQNVMNPPQQLQQQQQQQTTDLQTQA